MRRAMPMLLLVCALVTLPFAAALADHKDGKDNGSPPDSPPGQSDRDDPPGQSERFDRGDNDHPSGKDRSEEPGNSFPQGQSLSDPDDDGHGPDRSNGGPDKPGGSGGFDSDKDGNNGCGNDDDFEDDNEGLCLGRLKEIETIETSVKFLAVLPTTTTTPVTPTFALSTPSTPLPDVNTQTLIRAPVRAAPLAAPAAPAAPATEVLSASGAPAVDSPVAVAPASVGSGGGLLEAIGNFLLPLTGGPIGILAMTGMASLATGGWLLWQRRRAMRLIKPPVG